jgi:hypothetical protein
MTKSKGLEYSQRFRGKRSDASYYGTTCHATADHRHIACVACMNVRNVQEFSSALRCSILTAAV